MKEGRLTLLKPHDLMMTATSCGSEFHAWLMHKMKLLRIKRAGKFALCLLLLEIVLKNLHDILPRRTQRSRIIHTMFMLNL